MTDPLDAELDRLFRLPPGELVAARNALSDQLRKAGDKAGAARVKALKRAVPVAWALNQVWFTEPALLERALERTRALRALHTEPGVDARRLSGALEQQRIAAQAVVEAALRLGRSAGMSDAALAHRRLFTTVQAWLAGQGEEAPGRMTEELQASGFDAFSGLTLPLPAAADETPAASTDDGEGAERDALEQAKQQLAEREQLVATVLDQVRTRSAALTAAQQSHDQARRAVQEAEQRLREQQEVLAQRAGDLDRRAVALKEANDLLAQAEAAVASARARLAAKHDAR